MIVKQQVISNNDQRMQEDSVHNLLLKIRDLEERLSEANQFIHAIQEGEVDAFAIRKNNTSEIYTLQSKRTCIDFDEERGEMTVIIKNPKIPFFLLSPLCGVFCFRIFQHLTSSGPHV